MKRIRAACWPVTTLLLSATLAAWSGIAVSEASEVTAPSEEAVQASEAQEFASELLTSLAEYLAGLPGYRVDLVASYDVVQDTGQKIEFNEIREITLARPNQLRIELQKSDGSQDLVIFDGKDINISDTELGVYARAPQPGPVDDAVVYFERDLGMRLPLSALLSTRMPLELSRRVTSVDYVEYTEILGTGAHHIAARTSAVDFQVWIADGEQPLPLRIVLTYKTEPGQPQFRAQFINWDTQSQAPAEAFRFEPPADATQIIFAVQGIVEPSETAASTTEQSGDPQ